MVVERKVIDVTELARPGRLERELGEHPEGLSVGERGRVIGTIMPDGEHELDRRLAAIPVHGVDGSPLPDGRMTPEQVEQLLAAIKPRTTIVAQASAGELASTTALRSGARQAAPTGNVIHDDWYAQWQWNRRFDHGLADIGGAIGPLPGFTFSAERLNRVLGIIGLIKDLDAREMRRIVDESRHLGISVPAKDEQVAETTQS